MTYHAKVSADGSIVLPAHVALAMGLKPGDHVQVGRHGSDIVVKTDTDVIEAGQRAFKDTIKQPFTVDEFIAGRRAEAARD